MSAARLMVLGIVRRHGEVHGYRIHQDIITWEAQEWTSVKTGSIYHALNQMMQEGLLKSVLTESSKVGPKRTKYALAATGRAEFVKLLEAALQDADLKLLAAGIAFMDALPRSRVLELLNFNLVKQTSTQTYLHTLPSSPYLSEPSENPELIGMWRNYHDSCVNTLQGMIARITAGAYTFAGETRSKKQR